MNGEWSTVRIVVTIVFFQEDFYVPGSITFIIVLCPLEAQVTNDPELFKKLTDTIWEFRTLYNKTYYRLFAFRDKTDGHKTLVLATHGLIKKTGKTPQADLEKAERIRQQYFEQKK